MEYNLCDLNTVCIRIEDHCLDSLTYVRRNGVICGAFTVCRNAYLEVFLLPCACPCAERAACLSVAGLHLEVYGCRLCAVGCELCVCLLVSSLAGLSTSRDVCVLVRSVSAVGSYNSGLLALCLLGGCCSCGRIGAAAIMEHNLCDLNVACIRIEDHCLDGLTYVGRDGIICGALTVCRNAYLEVFLLPCAVPCAERAACLSVAGLHLEVYGCRLCAVGCELCVCLLVSSLAGLSTGGDVCILVIRRISAVCSCCGCGRVGAAALIQNDLFDLNAVCIRIEDHCLDSCADVRRNAVSRRASAVCRNAYLEVFLNPIPVPCAERDACFGVAGLHSEVYSCSLCAVGSELCVCLLVPSLAGLCAGGDVGRRSALRSSSGSCLLAGLGCCCCSRCACSSLLCRHSGCDRTAADAFNAGIYRTSLIDRIQTCCCADQTSVVVQGHFVCLIVVYGIGVGEVGICRTADQSTDQRVAIAAVVGSALHFVKALIAGGCSVMRILGRIAVHTHNEVHVLGVVAQDHAHLRLAPAGIVLAALCGIFRGSQCCHLQCSVITCTAPVAFAVICAFAGALAVQICGDLCPVHCIAGDLTLEDRSTQADIIPAHGGVYAPLASGLTRLTGIGVVHELVQERAVGAVLGCQVQPACCPCLVVIVIVRAVEVCSLRAICLIGLDGIIVQCLCVLQVFCVAEVDVVHCQCCGIFCSNIAGIIRSPVSGTQTLIVLGLRRAPDIMVSLSYAYLIAEAGYGIAAQLCACLKEIAEAICQCLQMSCLSQCIIAVFKFIVAPAQSRCSIACRQTELYVVACIVKAAIHLIAAVAVVSPVKLRRAAHIRATHISVIKIHGILQQLCIIIIRCSRYAHTPQRCHSRQRRCSGQ